jgi:hypothetical protein
MVVIVGGKGAAVMDKVLAGHSLWWDAQVQHCWGRGGRCHGRCGVAGHGIRAVRSGATVCVVGGRWGGSRWEWALRWTMRLRAVEFRGDAVHQAVLLGVVRPCYEGSVLGGEAVVQQTMGGDAVVKRAVLSGGGMQSTKG